MTDTRRVGRGAGPFTPPAPARRLGPGYRRWLTMCAVIVVLALAVGVVAFVAAARSSTGMSRDHRDLLQAATRDAVQELMTFSPATEQRDRERVAVHLTGRLAAEYGSQGPDVVFVGARRLNVTMTAKVVGVGVRTAGHDGDDVGWTRMLVFGDQTITVPGNADTTDQRASIARWAFMRNVDGNWRLADLTPVGRVAGGGSVPQ